MEYKTEKIIEAGREVRLRPEEKSLIRDSLISYMNVTPVASPFYKSWFSLGKRSMVFVALFLIILLGASTSTFAKEALPGDFLYPVKIHVNENIESLLATSPKAKAEVEIKHATVRLKEAEVLEIKGQLNQEKNTEIKNSFSKAVNSMNDHVKSLENKGDLKSAVEVNDNFTDEINTHYKAFVKVSGDSTTTEPFSGIIHSIKNRKDSESNKSDGKIKKSNRNINKNKNKED